MNNTGLGPITSICNQTLILFRSVSFGTRIAIFGKIKTVRPGAQVSLVLLCQEQDEQIFTSPIEELYGHLRRHNYSRRLVAAGLNIAG